MKFNSKSGAPLRNVFGLLTPKYRTKYSDNKLYFKKINLKLIERYFFFFFFDFKETITELRHIAPQANLETLKTITSFGYAIQSSEETPYTKILPDFPCDNLKQIAKICEANSLATPYNLIYRLYPFNSFLPKESQGGIISLLETLKIEIPKEKKDTSWIRSFGHTDKKEKIISVEQPTLSKALSENTFPCHKGEKFFFCFCFKLKLSTQKIQIIIFRSILVSIQSNAGNIVINVPGGIETSMQNTQNSEYIETNYQNSLMSEIIQSYAAGDICLIGPKGSGKSMLISHIAHLLNQSIEPMVLYQDMTARDFLQQRSTTSTGDTIWTDSPLIRAAKNGCIAVLDGIHRIHSSTFSILHR